MFNMLMKCNYLDKFHFCTSSRDRWAQSGMTAHWPEMMTEAIYICIPEDVKLRDLFVRWCTLSLDDRNSIDGNIITRERFDLYHPLKRAMVHWELVQDTQGAPGFENGLYAFTCDTRLEEELTNIVLTVDNIIDRTIENSTRPEKAVNLLDDHSPSKIKQLA